MDLLCDAIGYTQPHPDEVVEVQSRPEQPLQQQQQQQQQQAVRSNRCCHLCGRTYERADHLNRHLKSHENSRAHRCNRCPKSFNRADLLSRHQASHDRPEKPLIERGDRVANACVGCINSKSKCQDEKPCTRCQRKGIPCELPKSSTTTRERATSFLSASSGQERQSQPQSQAFTQHVLNVPMMMDGAPPDKMQDEGVLNQNDPVMYHGNGHLIPTHTIPFDTNPSMSHFDPTLGLISKDSYFSQDIDFVMWDIDMDSVEMAWQDFDQSYSLERAVSHTTSDATVPLQKTVSRRFAAFERSPWLWKPTQNDRAFDDHQDLNVDEENIPPLTPDTQPGAGTEDLQSCHIKQKQRDQMISLLFTAQQGANGQPGNSTPTLPSLSLLNCIIQIFFTQQKMRVDHLIHMPTFNPVNALPQLLLSVVSAGSTLISTPPIWKMGFALQEVVRRSVGQYWEQNNSHTRSLQAIQAFMIVLDVGLWSGFKRKMEIAESFALPVVIMLRRAGAFASTGEKLVPPSESDSPSILESKWRKWVDQESWKRLTLHLFIHDTHASMGLQKPPLMTFTELRFPLPAPRALWLARSAQEWRAIYLTIYSSPQDSSTSNYPEQTPLPTFLEAIHSPDTLLNIASQIDVHLTSHVLLHGHWGQIWSMNEARKFFPAGKTTHILALHAAYTELYRDLSLFSALIPTLTRNDIELTMVAELMLMFLHVSPEDLQRFAGKFGEEEARRASEEFVLWARTKEARLGVWHAGQVVSAAEKMPMAQMRGFNAIALYYASLTHWVYGLMIPHISPLLLGPESQVPVVLNGTENMQVRAFLAGGVGELVLNVKTKMIPPAPGIEQQDFQLVSLRDADRVLEVARGIYRDNFRAAEEGDQRQYQEKLKNRDVYGGNRGSDDDGTGTGNAWLPPLVRNLSELLRDLGLGSSRGSREGSLGH